MSGSADKAPRLSVSLPLLLHQILPWAPEEALQYALGLLDMDAFDGVRLEQELSQPVEASRVQGDRGDWRQVLAAVVLFLQSWTHLKWVGLMEELIDQDACLELVKFTVLGG